MSSVFGLAAIRKPAGLTSFKALAPLKRKTGITKIGHTGTLDLFASGLLVVLIGGYSHLAPWFTSLDKRYRARILFGEETDTLDPEGKVIATALAPTLADLEAALPSFRGAIVQRPPSFSAIHVAGKRAYERVLAGETLEMAERPVTIRELTLEGYDGNEAEISVVCSSGTYIRSLARDIALAIGSRARLAALERSSVGPFKLENAVFAEDFDSNLHLRQLDPDIAIELGLRPRRIGESSKRVFLNGGRLLLSAFSDFPSSFEARNCASPVCSAVFAEDDSLLGVVEEGTSTNGNGDLRYRFVLSRST